MLEHTQIPAAAVRLRHGSAASGDLEHLAEGAAAGMVICLHGCRASCHKEDTSSEVAAFARFDSEMGTLHNGWLTMDSMLQEAEASKVHPNTCGETRGRWRLLRQSGSCTATTVDIQHLPQHIAWRPAFLQHAAAHVKGCDTSKCSAVQGSGSCSFGRSRVIRRDCSALCLPNNAVHKDSLNRLKFPVTERQVVHTAETNVKKECVYSPHASNPDQY